MGQPAQKEPQTAESLQELCHRGDQDLIILEVKLLETHHNTKGYTVIGHAGCTRTQAAIPGTSSTDVRMCTPDAQSMCLHQHQQTLT